MDLAGSSSYECKNIKDGLPIFFCSLLTSSSFSQFESLTWIRQLNPVFCTNRLGQKELQKSLDAPSGCACVFLQPFASKAFAQKSHV
ncbi:MAG: hypothetical protein GKR87_07590 [Kiritimatiellae bacterium]|nr:hypothetical protein [Kiritimatiellia bacterium]